MIAELEKLRFFRNTSAHQLEVLSAKAYVRDYAAGETIFATDMEDRFIGFIIDGVGLLSVDRSDGNLLSVETFNNSPVGLTFLDGFKHPGAMTAKTDVTIIAWTMDDLDEIADKHPRLALDFYKGLNFYLVQTIRRMIGLVL